MQYIKIKESIVEQIESGQLLPGQKLPSERILAESFATTRVTLREALSLLEAEGVVYREDRRGWFISPEPLRYDPQQGFDFEKMALTQARVATTQLLSAKSMLATKSATTLLDLPPFSQVYCFQRVLHLDKRPVAYVVQYVRADRFPELLKQNLEVPLAELYRRYYQQHYQQVYYRLAAASLSGEMAQMLRATSGSPSTLIERVHFNEQAEKIDCAFEYWRHDAMCIESVVSLKQD